MAMRPGPTHRIRTILTVCVVTGNTVPSGASALDVDRTAANATMLTSRRTVEIRPSCWERLLSPVTSGHRQAARQVMSGCCNAIESRKPNQLLPAEESFRLRL
ncbi:hypothetical protein Bbelb_045480 [Branchiostoma belcheri]|nr:hypothetical protein Bbelb_045480 [Branchiostoma belcheri]